MWVQDVAVRMVLDDEALLGGLLNCCIEVGGRPASRSAATCKRSAEKARQEYAVCGVLPHV